MSEPVVEVAGVPTEWGVGGGFAVGTGWPSLRHRPGAVPVVGMHVAVRPGRFRLRLAGEAGFELCSTDSDFCPARLAARLTVGLQAHRRWEVGAVVGVGILQPEVGAQARFLTHRDPESGWASSVVADAVFAGDWTTPPNAVVGVRLEFSHLDRTALAHDAGAGMSRERPEPPNGQPR